MILDLDANYVMSDKKSPPPPCSFLIYFNGGGVEPPPDYCAVSWTQHYLSCHYNLDLFSLIHLYPTRLFVLELPGNICSETDCVRLSSEK